MQGNPALWFIYNQLKEKYNVTISSFHPIEKGMLNKNIKYKTHSFFYKKMEKNKRAFFFRRAYNYFYGQQLKKKPNLSQIIIEDRLRFFYSKIELYLKNRTVDFIINIDTEAAYISKPLSEKCKIPNAYFIYEFYAHQTLEIDNAVFVEKTNIEKEGVLNSDIILSGANDLAANYLLKKYNSKAKAVTFTVCPLKKNNKTTECHTPLKLYYHGALFDNRGLKEAILAMREIEGAILHIRGFGDYEKELKETVINNDLAKKVIFLPVVPTELLTEVAAEFDIGLTMVRMNILNHVYAMGFKTFENISAGLALIMPASVPLKQLNNEYKVGLTYEDATTDNLVKLFQYCVDNPNLVREWKKNAQTAYEKEYNQYVQQNRLIREIETLLNTKKKKPR
ncbi:MAG: glycosyltransferase [Bacteroidetes bacterium]|nr:glycosyltransferase [Bacteroidota bacterium]